MKRNTTRAVNDPHGDRNQPEVLSPGPNNQVDWQTSAYRKVRVNDCVINPHGSCLVFVSDVDAVVSC
eukprot:gene854-4126_t